MYDKEKNQKVEVPKELIKQFFFKPYGIKVRAKSQLKMGPNELKDHMIQTHDLKLIRGHFLDLIIDVETVIEVIVENYMVHKNSGLWKVFRENILSRITFEQKIDLLYAIINERKALNSEDSKKLKSSLDFLRSERNKWAHGVMRFEQEKKEDALILQAYLNWRNTKGEEKEIRLTDSYFDELTKKFEINQSFLTKILVKRKLLSKESIKGK